MATYIGTSEADEYTGSTGADTISGKGGDDKLYGDAGDDVIYGDDGDDWLDGGLGLDTLYGGAGDDIYYVDQAWDLDRVFELVGQGIDTVYLREGGFSGLYPYVLGANVENLVMMAAVYQAGGNALNNRITGNSDNNLIYGYEGNDILIAGGGWDDLYGGPGDDVYYVDSFGGPGSPSQRVLEYSGEGMDTVISSVGYRINGFVEKLILTGTAGNGIGNSLNNVIIGNDQNNYLDGERGSDRLVGGLGNDTYLVDNLGDVIVEMDGQGHDIVQTTVSFSLAGTSIEEVFIYGAASDYAPIDLTGNEYDNQLDTTAGNNIIDGRGGDDTVRLQSRGVSLHVDLSITGPQDTGGGIDTFISIENLIGSYSDDVLRGTAGNNRLDGGGGVDILTGGFGHDIYVVDNARDRVVEGVIGGVDTVEASVSFTLAGTYAENLVLTGTAIRATGNKKDNIISGNDADNVINGGAGRDTMMGGGGNDSYYVDTVGDQVREDDGRGIDTIYSSVGYQMNGAYVENIVLTGTKAINARGNPLENVLTGNGAANNLRGGEGRDDLHGALGTDILTGDIDGPDAHEGNRYADRFWFDTELGAGNVDTITDFASGEDRIILDDAIFATLVQGDLAVSAFRLGPVALDGDDRILYERATGNIWFDADGSGSFGAQLFAQLPAGTWLIAADFLVV